ncbi:hypothetical protein NP493_300g00017 [Ridgeia piscesae]|uniref:Uncharacterized protein n=1 Tax=Ridgeia piscesae TaxID=27915 RepID=A0AAD9NW71_RIDPI|nr:hypothetical protein NP493_300g00017 [Ridgeia piscesae]
MNTTSVLRIFSNVSLPSLSTISSLLGGVTHHGVATAIDEEVSPSLENTIVYLWLQLIYPGLPLLVKQRYGAELRNRSMASLKPEISQALASLQDELCNIEDTRAMRIWDGFKYNRKVVASSRRRSVPHKSCVLCKPPT